MLGNLESDLKKVLLAGIGALATTVEKSKDIVDELVKKGEITVEQGKALNEELKHDIQEQKEEVSKRNEVSYGRENRRTPQAVP